MTMVRKLGALNWVGLFVKGIVGLNLLLELQRPIDKNIFPEKD